MSDSPRRPSDHCAEIVALFARGAEFSRRLIAENQRLRERCQEQLPAATNDLQMWERLRPELLACLEGLRSSEEGLAETLTGAREESLLFAQRCAEVETENDRLAALYVASDQLHSTLDLAEVLKIIIEITLNLIGAERIAIFVLDEGTGQLEAVVAEGLTLESLPRATRGGVDPGGGALRSALESGAIVCRDPEPTRVSQEPLVAIPMRVLDRPIGVIAIYRFLSHKDGISLLDRELFTLLAGAAARRSSPRGSMRSRSGS